MAFGHGKDAAFSVATVAGTLTDISAYVTSVKLNTGRDEADITALGASYKNFLAGVQDASIDVEGIYDPTVDAILFALGTATSTTWTYGPQGTASGSVKFSGTALRGDYNIPTSVSDAVTWDANFHVKGAITRGTF